MDKWSENNDVKDVLRVECSSISHLDICQLSNSRWFKVFKRFLRISCNLNGIHLVNIQGVERFTRTKTINKSANSFQVNSFRRQIDWSIVIRFLLALLGLKLSISTYHSYRFDFYSRRFSNEIKSIGTNNLTAFRLHEMRQKLEETHGNLIGIGVLYEKLNFFVEIWNIFVVATIFLVDFYLYIEFNYLTNVHYILGGIAIDFEAVQRSYSRIVLKQVHRLIVSSDNFHQTRTKDSLFQPSGPQIDPKLANLRSIRSKVMIRWKREELLHRLRAMLSSGQLGPLTWQTDWLNHIGLINLAISGCFWLYSIGLVLLVYVLVPVFSCDGPFDWWQLMRASDEVVIFLVCIATGSFYIPIMVVADMDHMRHLDKLIDLIKWCRVNNEAHYWRIVHANRFKSPSRCLSKGVNGLVFSSVDNISPANESSEFHLANDMLFALIHYRVSVSLAKSMERTSRVFLVGALVLFFLLPVTTLLHGPYINDRLVKYSYTFMSIINLFLFNLMMIPMCKLHNRSVHLYKSMSNLLAHSIDRQLSLVGALNEVDIYDQHLVGLLRKELRNADKMARQFTIVVLGVPMTYATLLRIHFWFGLIMLASTGNSGSQGGGQLLGRFFSDPFRLF